MGWEVDIRYKEYVRGRYSCQKGIFFFVVIGGFDSFGLLVGRYMRMRRLEMKDVSENNFFCGYEVIMILLYYNVARKIGLK